MIAVNSRLLKNFYPRPPRGGRQLEKLRKSQTEKISIHALREEGDGPDHPAHAGAGHFYPRPPRGGRPQEQAHAPTGPAFLSTPSARRATRPQTSYPCRRLYFYPRPPRGGRHLHRLPAQPGPADFYPRPPRGGRLLLCVPSSYFKSISIHALREEGDGARVSPSISQSKFLSTPSARRATTVRNVEGPDLGFLSTPSARRATRGNHDPSGADSISIHALREEGDDRRYHNGRNFQNFYPRPPRGGRPERDRRRR